MRELIRKQLLAFGAILSVFVAAGSAKAENEFIVTGFGGVMTADVWEDAIQFWDADYMESYLVGVGVGQDVWQFGRVNLGYELQVVKHFGMQHNWEINAPIVIRYDREGQRLPVFSSLAFGIGLGWATEIPEIEIMNDGDSTQALIYWMGEIEFDLPGTEIDAVFRIHHRSDGYGVFPVDAGSNALAIGIRRRF